MNKERMKEYSTVQKYGVSKCFWKKYVSYAHQNYFHKFRRKKWNIFLFKIAVFYVI